MGYTPHLIAPFKSSLVKYYKPWIIGNDAFPVIDNAYTWRGQVKKREGYQLFASLPGGDAPVQGLKNWTNPSTLSQTSIAYSRIKSYIYNAGYQDITFLAKPPGTAFSWSNADSEYFWTSNFAGSMWSTNNLTADNIRFWNGSTGALGVAGGWSIHKPTVNGTTTLNAALIILPYKGRLVVLNTSEGNSFYPGRARWCQIGTPYTSNVLAVAISGITAANPAVVSIANTSGFVVNQPAGILGVLGSMAALLNFNQFNVTAIVPNVSITIDVDTTGLTYTSSGTAQGPGTTVPPTPFEISIFGWRDDIAGRGGFIDADTSERIVTADIVKDVLIVGFQRSTWRLRYTGNEILPFIWERINTQYGAESTFSNVPFDDAVLMFSRYGWVASDTNDVARIDENIPDDSFSVDATNTNLKGLSYIQGIRDYYRQFAYWTFPNQALEEVQDNADQIYAYNYIDKTWNIFTPSNSIRTFGTYVESVNKTWASLSLATDIWSNFNDDQSRWELFGTSQNIGFPIILGGDQLGNVYEMFAFQQESSDDNGVNFDFTIKTKRMNPYIEEGMKCRIGYVDIYCTTVFGGKITFNHYIDDQSTPVFSRVITLCKNQLLAITNVVPGVTTAFTTFAEHNLVDQQLVTITDLVGTIAPILNNNSYVATVTSTTTFTIDVVTTGYTYTGGGNIPIPLLASSGDQNYTRVYLGAIGYMHQFEFTMTEQQTLDPVIGKAAFELQGLVVWSQKAGRIKG